MNKYIKYFAILALLCVPSLILRGQDDSQSDLRENPDMESVKSEEYIAPKVEYPLYIDLDANHIEMNGADWTDLVAKIDSAGISRLNILHLGDSHLQADMATAVTRTRLGEHYGSAGRSLVIPFKLAGTNEPVDYSIVSETTMEQARLLKKPWPTEMSFTGIAIRPHDNTFELNISAPEPFDSVVVYYTGKNLSVLNEGRKHSGDGYVSIALDDTCSTFGLQLQSDTAADIHGLNLLRGNAGVAYHVIGNNGATFDTYNEVEKFFKGVSTLSPSLIIISLGTNEAYGNISDEEMTKSIHTLIRGLKSTCPTAKLLLTTPSECQRKAYRGKGRRRRATGYAVNTKVKRMRGLILDYARKENIPVYDFYEVAGGAGSSNKWLSDGKMNKDRIHLLRPGYTLQGHLFTDALEEAFQKFRPNS